jgi:hypothetical protein
MTSGLYRTFNPKMPHYLPDGAGRDHYIRLDNGGLHPLRMPNPSETTQLRVSLPGNMRPSPRNDATCFRY